MNAQDHQQLTQGCGLVKQQGPLVARAEIHRLCVDSATTVEAMQARSLQSDCLKKSSAPILAVAGLQQRGSLIRFEGSSRDIAGSRSIISLICLRSGTEKENLRRSHHRPSEYPVGHEQFITESTRSYTQRGTYIAHTKNRRD